MVCSANRGLARDDPRREPETNYRHFFEAAAAAYFNSWFLVHYLGKCRALTISFYESSRWRSVQVKQTPICRNAPPAAGSRSVTRREVPPTMPAKTRMCHLHFNLKFNRIERRRWIRWTDGEEKRHLSVVVEKNKSKTAGTGNREGVMDKERVSLKIIIITGNYSGEWRRDKTGMLMHPSQFICALGSRCTTKCHYVIIVS